MAGRAVPEHRKRIPLTAEEMSGLITEISKKHLPELSGMFMEIQRKKFGVKKKKFDFDL